MEILPNGNNSTIVAINNAVILVSYQTPVAAFIDGRYIKTAKKWSNTTTRQLKNFLGAVSVEIVDQTVLDNLLKNA